MANKLLQLHLLCTCIVFAGLYIIGCGFQETSIKDKGNGIIYPPIAQIEIFVLPRFYSNAAHWPSFGCSGNNLNREIKYSNVFRYYHTVSADSNCVQFYKVFDAVNEMKIMQEALSEIERNGISKGNTCNNSIIGLIHYSVSNAIDTFYVDRMRNIFYKGRGKFIGTNSFFSELVKYFPEDLRTNWINDYRVTLLRDSFGVFEKVEPIPISESRTGLVDRK